MGGFTEFMIFCQLFELAYSKEKLPLYAFTVNLSY